MRRILFIIFVFSFLLSRISLSQLDLNFDHITIDDGLSQSTIHAIIQDKEGFMWFGTYDGLNKYDGYKFTVFKNNPKDKKSVAEGYINCLFEDKQGRIWIGTANKGLDIFDKATNVFTHYKYDPDNPNSISDNRITSIYQDKDDNLWISTFRGLNKYIENSNEFVRYLSKPNAPNSLPHNNIFSISEDDAGNILIGVQGNKLSILDPVSETIENIVFSESYKNVNANNNGNIVFVDSEGEIWIGTEGGGIFRKTKRTEEFINYSTESIINPLSNDFVNCLFEDNEGRIWIGTEGGLNIFNKSTNSIYYHSFNANNPKSVSSNAIYSLCEDAGNTFWVGTYGAGINKYNKYKIKFKHYAHNPQDENSLTYKSVLAIFEDSDNNIWIGTDGGGLDLFDMKNERFIHYKHDPDNPRSFPSNVIIQITEDKNQNLWLGTYAKGLIFFDRKRDIYYNYMPDPNNPNSIGHENVWTVLEDTKGNLWVGTMGNGLDLFDRNTGIFHHYRPEEGNNKSISGIKIKIIFEDSRGNLWIGTEDFGLNLYHYVSDNFTRFVNEEGNFNSLSNNDVRDLFEDSQNHLWIATGGGLNLFDYKAKTFTVYTEEFGLPNNTIDGILEDNSGNLWISTNNGIAKFNLKDSIVRNYDVGDGLQGREFNYTNATLSSTGEMYFGGINGLNVFNPNNIEDNPYPPKVIITDFKIFNISIPYIDTKIKDTVIFTPIFKADHIKLSYKENIFSFEFAALDYSAPEKNKYAYMLEGFDDDWINTDADKRYATYSNLDGGDYLFRVKASNNDGVWNEEGIGIGITIVPPFWKTWWFRITAFIFAVLVFVTGARLRIMSLKREKNYLEEKIHEAVSEIEEKTKELEDQNRILLLKKEEDDIRNWASEGFSKFGDILRLNNQNIEKLSNAVILGVIKQIEVDLGGIWIKNINEEDEEEYELKAAIGYDKEKVAKRIIHEKEELVGACIYDKKTHYITDLPETYIKVTSGLGQSKAKFLLLVPLIYHKEIFGVIEVASFKEIEEYKIKYIEELGEKIASSIINVKNNEKTNELLKTTKLQANELQASEEALRQNLEEMLTTQEQNDRKEKKLLKEIEELKEKIKILEKKNKSLKK